MEMYMWTGQKAAQHNAERFARGTELDKRIK